MNVAIIGCGQVGQKRLRSLGSRHRLVAAADTDRGRAEHFVRGYQAHAVVVEWRAAIERPDVDVVIVATTHNHLAEITLAAVEAGKHVLVEKPGARRPDELEPVIAAAERHRRCVEVGFNLRFHPALQKAREIVDSGALGALTTIRGRYGHGGHLGYDRAWRSDPEVAGGGELIDQGVHLIDLARWFLGDFTQISGFTASYFWERPVEDNAFMLLRTVEDHAAWLHVNCAEWKNLFSFEIFGRDGKLQIDGLGGSYGVERLTYYKMLPEMGPPETTIWEYPFEDRSWRLEFDAFVCAIEQGALAPASLLDARAALGIVERVYSLNRDRTTVARP
jgi:predicted dehydrogenase